RRQQMSSIMRFVGFAVALSAAWPARGEPSFPTIPAAKSAKAPAASALKPVSVKNGILRRKVGRDAIAPMRIETPTSAHYILKLVNTQNGAEEMLIYVSSNSEFETKIPLGTYTIRGAYGEIWYGEEKLFGPDTSYFRLVLQDGKTERFVFQRNGNRVNGY